MTDLGIHDVNITGTIPSGYVVAAYVYDTDELNRNVYGVIGYKINVANVLSTDEVITIKFTLASGDLLFSDQYLWEFISVQPGMTKAQEAFVQFLTAIYNDNAKRDALEGVNYYSPNTNGDILARRCFTGTNTEVQVEYIGQGDQFDASTYIDITRTEDSLFCISGETEDPVFYFLEDSNESFASNCAAFTVTVPIFKNTPNSEVVKAVFQVSDGVDYHTEYETNLLASTNGFLTVSSNSITEVNGTPLSPNTVYNVKVILTIVGSDIPDEEFLMTATTAGNTSIDLLYAYNPDAETVTIYYDRNIGGNDLSIEHTYRIRVWNGVSFDAWQSVTKSSITAQSHTFTGVDSDKFEMELIFNSDLACEFTLTADNDGCDAAAVNVVTTNHITLENASVVAGGGSITFEAFNSYNGTVEAKLQNITAGTETGWVTVTVAATYSWTALSPGEYIIHVRDVVDLTCVNSTVVLTILGQYQATRSFTATCAAGFEGTPSEAIVTYNSLISTADAISNALAQATANAQAALVCEFDLDRFTTLSAEDEAELFINESFTLSYTLDDGGHWVSFHTYIPDFYINTRTKLFNFKDGVIFENNKGQRGKYYTNEIFPMIIEPVFNGTEDGMNYEDKMFYNINWNSEILDASGNYLNETFSRIRARNNNIDTGEKVLKVYQNLSTLSANTRRVKSRWNFDRLRDDNVLAYRRTRALDTFLIIDLIFWNNANKVLYLFDIDSEFSLVQR